MENFVNSLKVLKISLIFAVFSPLFFFGMERLNENRTSEQEQQEFKIRKLIASYQSWNTVLQHLQRPRITPQGTASGFHIYTSQKQFHCNGNFGKYIIHEVSNYSNTWVVLNAAENHTSYHSAYVLQRLSNGSFAISNFKKSFFPCNKTPQQIIELVKSKINNADVQFIYTDTEKSIAQLQFSDNNTQIKVIVTILAKKETFFINTLYPIINSGNSINQQEQSDLLLCQKEIERQYSTSTQQAIQKTDLEDLINTITTNDINSLEIMLNNGLDPETTITNKPLLMYVAEKNLFEIFSLLLSLGVDIHKTNNLKISVLDIVLRDTSDPLLFAILLQMCADQLNLNELLIKAIQALNLEAIKLIIAQDADVNFQDHKGDTPLHHCIYNAGNDTEFSIIDAYNRVSRKQVIPEIVQCLLRAGADLEIPNNKKETIAEVLNSNQWTRSYLVKKQINKYLKEKNDFFSTHKEFNDSIKLTKLLWAVVTQNSKKLIELLQQSDDKFLVGQALKEALSQEIPNTTIIRLIQKKLEEFEEQDYRNYNKKVAKIDQQVSDEQKLEHKYYEALKIDNLSIMTDAELNQLDKKKSLLCHAIEENKSNSVMELLNRKISNMHETKRGLEGDKRTALQIAYDSYDVKNDNQKIIIFLLSHKDANPKIIYHILKQALKDKNNNNSPSETAFSLIIKKPYHEIIELLVCALEDEKTFDEKIFIGLLNHIEFLINDQNSLINFLNTQDKNGKTLLMYVCRLNKLDIAKKLLESPISLTQKDNIDCDALSYALPGSELKKLLYDKLNPNKDSKSSPKPNDPPSPNLNESPQIKKHKKNKKQLNEQFLLAVKDGNLVKINELLPYIDINYKDKNNTTALWYALKLPTIEPLKLLLSKNIDISIPCKSYITPLMFAAQHSTLEMVKLLVTYGANIHEVDKIGNTPLIIASQQGNKDIVEYLISKAVDITHKNNDGSTAYHVASQKGKTEILKILDKMSEALHFRLNNNGDSPFHIACKYGNTETVDYFLTQKKCDVNSFAQFLNTGLMFAVKNGHIEVVKLLLAHKAPIYHMNSYGETAFQLAQQTKNAEVVKYLKEYIEHHNFLFHEIDNGVSELRIIKNYTNINYQNADGATFLTNAILSNNKKIIDYLLKNGADPNLPGSRGFTPLSAAITIAQAFDSDLIIAKKLLDSGANIEKINPRTGNTPLIYSIVRLDEEFTDGLELLLDKGANINHQNFAAQTTLMICPTIGAFETAKILLKRGAHVNITDDKGNTALTIAKNELKKEKDPATRSDIQKIIDLIEEHKAKIIMYAKQNNLNEIANCLNKEQKLVNEFDNEGNTGLIIAASNGFSDLTIFLLRHEANLWHCNKLGQNALQLAVSNNHIHVVKTIINFITSLSDKYQKEVLDKRAKDFHIALNEAISKKHLEIAKLLLPIMKNPHLTDSKPSKDELVKALHNNNTKKLEEFINNGMNINEWYDDQTPLGHAINSCSKECISWLIKHGASTEVVHQRLQRSISIASKTTTNCETSALFKAVQQQNLFIVKVLLDLGVDPNSGEYSDGEFTSCLSAAIKDGSVEIVECLIKSGAYLDESISPLALASNNNNNVEKYIRELLDANAYLFDAIKKGDIEKIDQALKNGALVHSKDKDKNSPLYYAVQQGNLAIIVLLILETDKKIDLMEYSTGCKPLLLAIKEGKNKIVEKLLAYSMNRCKDIKINYVPALQEAIRSDNAAIIKLLIQLSPNILKYKTNDNSTLLINALKENKLAAAQAIIEVALNSPGDENRKKIFEIKNNLEETALSVAIAKSSHITNSSIPALQQINHIIELLKQY